MAPGEVLGRVAVEHRNAFALYTEAGEISGEVSGRLRHHASTDAGGLYPVVGDWVVVRPHSGGAKGAIQAVLPRRTRFVRGAAGTEGVPQIVAANVDVVFLVSGLDGELNPRRIERYITLARDGGAQPVVVLNKADLCDDADRERTRRGGGCRRAGRDRERARGYGRAGIGTGVYRRSNGGVPGLVGRGEIHLD